MVPPHCLPPVPRFLVPHFHFFFNSLFLIFISLGGLVLSPTSDVEVQLGNSSSPAPIKLSQCLNASGTLNVTLQSPGTYNVPPSLPFPPSLSPSFFIL